MQANDNNRAGSVHGCTQPACLHAGFPIPQWAALEGCTAVALMAEHDDARQASRQCARACGALMRVRRACLCRAPQAVPTQAVCARLWRADACAQGVPVARTAGGPYVPTSTDPMGILKNTREFKAPGADQEHTSEVRGGGRDPTHN